MLEKKFYNLTNPQKSIWVTEEYYKGSCINNICGTALIKEKVNLRLLEKAIRTTLQNNDIFKIKFSIKDNNIVQYVSDYVNSDIVYLCAKNYKHYQKLLNEIVSKPFHLLDSHPYNFFIIKFKNGNVAFCLNINHILADSWTLGFLSKQVIKTYCAYLLSDIPYQYETYSYIDYIKSEEKYKKSKRFLNDKEYWNKEFETIPDLPFIPGSINGSLHTENISADRIKYKLNKDFVKKIKLYCKKNNITLFNFFMAIYSIYIHSTTSLNDFVIGTPILNRVNFKEKNTSGMFVNMAPFRIKFSNIETFKDFIKYVASKSTSMLKHQKYSYQSLIEDLRKTHGNIPTLYNAVFSYQITNTQSKEIFVKNETDWIFNGNSAENLAIQIYDINNEGLLHICYDYKTSIYTSKDISSINSRIINIINQVIINEDILLNNIDILTLKEKNEIINKFNRTSSHYNKSLTLIDLFEKNTKFTPDNIAIIQNPVKFTYKELNNMANVIANKIGEIKGKKIAVLADKSASTLASFLGIMKSGNCYIPVDTEYPNERIQYILKNSEASILISLHENDITKNFNNKIIIDNLDFSKESLYKSKATPEDYAYIIYTSGTTGNPKGVLIKHKNIINTLFWRKKLYKFNKNTTVFQVPSFSFDSSVEDIFTPLISGGKLVLPSTPKIDINKMCEDIEKYNVNNFLVVPSLYKILLKEKHEKLKNLKIVTIAGEDFNLSLVKEHFKKLPNVRLINEYGPTENSVCSTYYELKPDDIEIYIGKPINNCKCYCLNNNLQPLPIGYQGELYVSGPGVSEGYLNKPDITKERFLNNLFDSKYKLYKTGDLVEYSENGNLKFIGRTDNQIKLHGYRIELKEIEQNILKNKNIQDVLVIKKFDFNNKSILVAYIIAKNHSFDENTLYKSLKETLPYYMIPSIVKIDKFPLTPNGKIDTKALPLPSINNKEREKIHPRNNTDKELIKLIEETLNTNNISLTDTIFSLGGDSLSAITLSSKISATFGVEIDIRKLLSDISFKEISDYIESNKYNNESRLCINNYEEKEYYPLSSAQRRIYYNTKMINEKNTVYNMPGSVLIDHIVDAEKIKNIFSKLIERHSSLRTSFVINENDVVQKVSKSVNFDIPTYSNTSDEIDKIISNFAKPFKLDKAPLFRVELHYIDNSKTLLLIDSHHIIMDGISLNILITEFNALYRNDDLETLPIEYKDYSLWENDYNENDIMQKNEEYWVKKFEGSEFSELNLPYDFTQSHNATYKGLKISKNIDKRYFDKVQEISSKYSVSPYIVFLSAFFVLLYKYTGQTDINIGTPFANREFEETQNIIGMFVNNIVLRGIIDKNSSFKDFVLSIKEQAISDLSNQPYPFDTLIKKLPIKNDKVLNSLFNTYFVYQNSEETHVEIDGKKYPVTELSNPISKFNLTFEIKPSSHSINVEYNIGLFKQETIETLFNHYINLLDNIFDNTDEKISKLSILSNEEKNKILYDFNQTEFTYDKTKTITQLFEEQVKRTPDKIAIVFENKTLTYSELNEKSNQLANYLRNKNVVSNNIIGIMLPRSLELLIAILGVLKSGACCVPIDPTFPEKRIEYMLENSQAKFLITTNELYNFVNFDNIINISNEDIYIQNHRNINNINTPEDIAYIIYTSGSTGLPKGVMLKHQSLVNLFTYLTNNIEFYKRTCPYKNIVCIATVSFDLFIAETLFPLQLGLKVILANEDEQRIPTLLDRLIQKNDGQIIHMTPSRMQLFLDNITDMPNLSNIKYITLVGEPLPLRLRDDLIKLGVKKIYNGYGPSETTVYTSFTDVTEVKEISIGKPLSNTQTYILDNDLNPVPIGVAGELYIAGDCVSAGYLNRADLTASRYLKNPFKNNIMYKSGDLCKYDKNGNIYCLGRTDNQIKIRGMRIELEEIENKILEFPDIQKVKVIKQIVGNREIISAYFIPLKKIRIPELRRYLYSCLPKYMIPSYFTPVDEFPYTPNGKIDQKSLPIPKGVLQSEHSNYIAPKTDLEIKLVSIWESILNTKPIGIKDNFFELGGDSVLAMSLTIQLLKINDNIKYADIFKYPTISDLIEKLESNISNSNDNTYNGLFEKYTEILEKNNIISNIKEKNNIKNILLTGCTGFLGIHILKEFLFTQKGIAYVIIRKDPGLSVKDKLLNKLHYYFGSKLDKYMGTRIIIIEGDITKDGFGLNQQDLFNLGNSVDAVINSAAKVSHYGNYQDFYISNVKSVENMIDFVNLFNINLFHISTLSVSGDMIRENYTSFSEKDFYIGQNSDNVYVKSKFEAEKVILDAVLKGTKAHILRIGNIMPRKSDGKFQENVEENAFINRIKTFIKLKVLPDNLSKINIEFTPVDNAATAILKVVYYAKENNIIYHIFNHKYLSISNLISILSDIGVDIKLIDSTEFKALIQQLLNSSKEDILNTLINELDKDKNLNYDKIIINSDYTIKFLKAHNFEWHNIDKNYIINILKLIKGE